MRGNYDPHHDYQHDPHVTSSGMKKGSLRKYKEKRNFKVTGEPEGKINKTSSTTKPLSTAKKKFVIQKHNASHLHYDFRLEISGTLASWAVPKGPSWDPKVRRLAMHVEDHPIDYGSFEGVIPKGEYGAGEVVVWDFGTWEPIEPKNPAEYESIGHLKFEIFGKKLKGIWNLVRFKTAEKGNTWLLIKDRDKHARSGEDEKLLNKKPESVLSKKTLKSLAKTSRRK